jgi:hypothetical protein
VPAQPSIRFAYVDAILPDGEELPLCRLRYAGALADKLVALIDAEDPVEQGAWGRTSSSATTWSTCSTRCRSWPPFLELLGERGWTGWTRLGRVDPPRP